MAKKRKRRKLKPHEKKHGRIPDLHVGDIILIRHKHNFFRHLLRIVINSYWDHSAMVIYPADDQKNLESSIIIESIRSDFVIFFASRGIAIHKLDKYLENPYKYEIAIKRVKELKPDELERVRKFMLMNVDAPYWPWNHTKILLAALFKGYRKKLLRRQRFSCSGLIQKAYYDAVDWDEKYRVIFKTGLWSPLELQELTSPGDLARHKKSEWIYNKHKHDA